MENGVKDLRILDLKEIKDVELYCEVKIFLGLKGLVLSLFIGYFLGFEIGSKILVRGLFDWVGM